ncbi:MAG TPA: sucrase ferredoxin [Jatrophihabitans sp.]|nr:sucrase ferredoxin [Jatrophihabitans sp.]
MADRSDRCRLQASVRDDPMLGTAFPASRILLVEQPGGWGPAGLADSRFDPAVAAELISGLGRRGVRVLAIRAPGRTAEAERRWALADCRPGRERLVWGSFAADRELLEIDPDAPSGQPEPGPVYAVCAHGRHDMCCAIDGRPIAAALDRLVPGRVFECSHVGGDRFAANVLVLPTGQLYGRVTDAAVLAAASERGQVLPELLRGRIGLPAPEQAGLVHAQRELALTGTGQLRVLGSEPVTDRPGQVRVRLAGPAGEYLVTVQRVAGQRALLTCRAGQPRVPLSYRPLGLEPAG